MVKKICCLTISELNKRIQGIVERWRSEGSVIVLDSQSEMYGAEKEGFIAVNPEVEFTISQDDLRAWETMETSLKPYQGRWRFGVLSYDLKNSIEPRLRSENPFLINTPLAYWMIPSVVYHFSYHTLELSCLFGVSENPFEEKTILSHAQVANPRPMLSSTQYKKMIKTAQKAIYEGDLYEVNLSYPIRASFTGDTWMLYQRLKSTGPVPMGAYVETPTCTLMSASPERFIRQQGARLLSEPIKGTRKRSKHSEEDTNLAQELRNDPKEQAENLMIVDLVRHDFSQICIPGSVVVPELFAIRTYPTVHQMVSKVEGTLIDPERSFATLKACFPMGSMTGAPKISAMNHIEALETYRRGWYSGSVGYIDPKGNMDWNVLIRTALVSDKNLIYPVGGAITSDSNADLEWKETQVKAQALFDISETKSPLKVEP